jgi:peptidyl-dipeptidase Dcp
MSPRISSVLVASLLVLSQACAPAEGPDDATGDEVNPFFVESTLPLGMPQFDQIRNEHFLPAFERGMQEHAAEVLEIANNPEPATFENVFVALELAGRRLDRVSATFFNLVSANTNDELEAIRTELAPRLAAHSDEISLNPELFARIEAIYDDLDQIDLNAEQRRLVERYHTNFVRAGATLGEADKERLRAMNAELAELATRFAQNVLSEVNASAVVVDSPSELAGLSEAEIQTAADAATERTLDGKYVIPLLNTSGQPPLVALEDRSLRQRILETSLARGSRGGEYDNRGVVSRVMRLRAERAALLGYPNHAAYVLENQTALTTEAVNRRLAELTPPAVANARREASALQQMIEAEGGDFEVQAWDWSYYAEKVRQAEYAFDESQLRPYLEMWTVLEQGVFFAANRLYGLSFSRRTDLPTYHPDVRVYEVLDVDGEQVALFLADYYARPSKRGGAWMNSYVRQSRLLEEKPVIANHVNVPKPPAGEPTLLTFDEVTTMFHEFGHALHGFFSDVTYPFFAGTSVPRDFVEFPSQVNEMWATWPEVLASYAVHHETGEPMPGDLVEKVLATETFNQGFATTEYLAASLVDQAFHQIPPDQVPGPDSVMAFEAEALRAAGAQLDEVPPRYRTTYFSHIFGGYDAGYYSYIWAEVLDADAVEWFKENGGLLRENGDHFRDALLSKGGSVDAMTLYRDFRGRDARVEPLLERRGLAGR